MWSPCSISSYQEVKRRHLQQRQRCRSHQRCQWHSLAQSTFIARMATTSKYRQGRPTALTTIKAATKVQMSIRDVAAPPTRVDAKLRNWTQKVLIRRCDSATKTTIPNGLMWSTLNCDTFSIPECKDSRFGQNPRFLVAYRRCHRHCLHCRLIIVRTNRRNHRQKIKNNKNMAPTATIVRDAERSGRRVPDGQDHRYTSNRRMRDHRARSTSKHCSNVTVSHTPHFKLSKHFILFFRLVSLVFGLDNDQTSNTTRSLDLESLIGGGPWGTGQSVSDSETDTQGIRHIRTQLEGLEHMYGEVLRMLGTGRMPGRMHEQPTLRTAGFRRRHGSVSSLPSSSVSGRPIRDRKRTDDRRKVRDMKVIWSASSPKCSRRTKGPYRFRA